MTALEISGFPCPLPSLGQPSFQPVSSWFSLPILSHRPCALSPDSSSCNCLAPLEPILLFLCFQSVSPLPVLLPSSSSHFLCPFIAPTCCTFAQPIFSLPHPSFPSVKILFFLLPRPWPLFLLSWFLPQSYFFSTHTHTPSLLWFI